MGISTLIVEETPWLGGMFTAAGVSAADGNRELRSGIWNEFLLQLEKHYGGPGALATGWVSFAQFEPHVGDSIFKALAAKEENLEIVYGYHAVSVSKEGNKVTGAVFENDRKERLSVSARITVDATDLGDVLKLSGSPFCLGMDARSETGESIALEKANDVVQDLTWVAILKDYGKGSDHTIEKPAGYHPEYFEGCCNRTVDNNAIDCEKMLNYGRLPNNKYMINWPIKGNDVYLNVVEMDREARAEALKKARKHTLCFIYHIQTALGFKHLGLADDEFQTADRLAYIPYHREGRRMKGIVTLNYNHVKNPYDQAEKLYRTGISTGDYPIDHHHKCNPDVPDLYFLPVPSFNVPLGALIPETTDGLIVADKAISVTNLVNGSTRLQPCVMLTGQAAGTLAALSVQENKAPRDVGIRRVQSALLDAGAYIMPLYDVKANDKDFKAIQRITATGLIKTTGEPHQWANRTWFYPDSIISMNEFAREINAFYGRTVVCSGEDHLPVSVQQMKKLLSSLHEPDMDFSKDREDRPLSRREVAVILDRYLRPFDREIDHNGLFTRRADCFK
jgi:hypothetical protein